jgi:hypothetical protein
VLGAVVQGRVARHEAGGSAEAGGADSVELAEVGASGVCWGSHLSRGDGRSMAFP